MRQIEIEWTYPRDYYRIAEHHYSNCIGLYYISRIWGGKETVIYVGETLQAFKDRMKQHNKRGDKYTQMRGKLMVRLGTIDSFFNFGNMNKEQFLQTLESAVIQNLKNKDGVKLVNKRQMKDFTYHYDIEIHNIGYRGKTDKNIITIKINDYSIVEIIL